MPNPRRLLFVSMTVAVFSWTPAPHAKAADAPLRVLTTTTDLADIVRVVGAGAVSVDSLCRGPEDPHFLDARPSFIKLAHEADLLVLVGMELEVGYLPLMLRDGSNPRIRPGTTGYLDASTRIRKLQVPEGGVSRALGDVHADGNPHYLWDPVNSVIVAEDVARALSALRPDAAADFASRAKEWKEKISDLMLGKAPAVAGKDSGTKGKRSGGLLERFKPFKGVGVVSYHDDAQYLALRLGLDVVDTLEPKPGVPPTAEHLRSLVDRAKGGAVKVVIYEVFQPEGPVRQLASATGARPVLVAHQPGATQDAPDLLSMYRRNAEVLLQALGAETSK